ncbi:MAG: DUF2339 domain-containing protein [Rhodobacteraceae bacterium]|nr:DUF2339 domain-containing protein [Paracoccaceae bacterium]
MIEILSLATAVVALVVAFRAHGRIGWLQRQIVALQASAPEEGQGQPPTVTAVTAPASGPPATEIAPRPPRANRRPAALARLGPWLRANWIYPVAGLALVMAAIFLVQYSVEKELLSPAARIGLAMAMGAALVAAAEILRRRWGEARTGLVPATLAGAGIVALLAALLAAYHLYAMLSAPVALAALAGVAALSVGLGWVHGPLLAGLGVAAGSAAPFLLGAGGPPVPLLYGYFGAIAALGLAIDGLRRWGWVSALAVVLPLAGGVLVRMAGAPSWGLALLALWIAALGTSLPGGRLVPGAEGAPAHRWRARPRSEVLVAALAVLGAVLVVLSQVKAPESILALGALAVLLPVWTARAPALSDLSFVAAAGLPLGVGAARLTTPLLLAFVLNAASWLPMAAVGLATLSAIAMIWRSEQAGAGARDLWAVLAVATPGATVVAAEIFWKPMTLMGALWPATAMALACGYTALALWAAQRDDGQGARLGAAAAGAFAAMALALMLVLSAAALTVALAVLLVAAAAMDRRLSIPHLGWIIGAGGLLMLWRLVLDPGVDPLLDGSLGPLDVGFSLVAVLAGPLAAVGLTSGMAPHRARDWGRVIAETGLSGSVPVVVAIVLARVFDGISAHAGLGIEAVTLIALAWVQAERARRLGGGRALRWLRRGLSALFGLAAALCLGAGLTILSPLFGSGFLGGTVRGWPVLNDLLLAYLAPAVTLGLATRGSRWGRAAAALVGAVWLGMAIRHLWHGASGMALSTGFRQPELYAYTVALLALGAASMVLAVRLGVTGYRLAGLALIGLAAAKGFLIDAAGLTGLLRVGAFLALGLSLAGLAWLNTWVLGRIVTVRKAPGPAA